jgi:hypothetical protein
VAILPPEYVEKPDSTVVYLRFVLATLSVLRTEQDFGYYSGAGNLESQDAVTILIA